MLYFDHNATSPLCATAREAWLDATDRFIGNPSSPHRLGARADTALTEARESLASLLGCDPHAIVWTSGATESNNMVVRHFTGTGELWFSAVEHPSVLESARRLFRDRHRIIPVAETGVCDLAWLRAAFEREQPSLVAIMAANNETGVLQPWQAARALCREFKVPFFCDASQWIGKMPAKDLGTCDFVSGCAHKFGGPQGVGFLKCCDAITPLLTGGPQEDRRRAGTENVAGVVAMVATLQERERAMKDGGHSTRLNWRDDFLRDVRRKHQHVQVLGESAERLWNTVCVLMPPAERQRWVVKFDKLGFAVSTGSACSSGVEKPSHVVAAMGYPPETADRVLRFSSGWETRASDWTELSDAFDRAIGATV